MTPREQRIPILDGVRGLAIVLVLINNLYPERAVGTVLDTMVVHFTDVWWIGVDLFFVLSGFLITGILADTRDGERYFRNFYARRFLRIFPLYYLALFFIFGIVPHFGLADSAQLYTIHAQRWYLWTYLGNLGYALHGNARFETDNYWSLAVEEQFYLLWPLFVLLLRRRQLIAFAIAMMAASFALRAAWLLHGLSQEWVYLLTPFRVDGLLVGAMVALVLRGPDGRARLRRWAPPVWRITAPLGLLLVAAYELPRNETLHTVLQIFGYPIISLAFGALIVFCLDAQPGSRLARWLGDRRMRFLGRYSYGIYVWHGLVLQMLVDRVGWVNLPPEVWGTRIPFGLLTLVLVTVLTIGVAYLSFHLFEKPILDLKRFFPYSHAVLPEGPPSAAGAPQPRSAAVW